MRLMLEFLRCEFGFKMRSQECHAVAVVGIQTQPHPNQMQMIRHEAIRRAQQSFACSGVQHQFAKDSMKSLVQPATPTMRDGQRPMHHGVALVKFRRQARKIKRPIDVWFIHGDGGTVAADVRRLKSKTGHGCRRRKEV